MARQPLASLITPAGRIDATPDGGLVPHVADDVATPGEPRRARAGDGLAAALYDAATDPAASELLAAEQGVVRVHRHAPVSESTARAPRDVTSGTAVLRERAIAVDMTNWAVIVDDRALVKVAARWGAVERAGRILDRLAERESQVSPALTARIEWELPGLGRSTVALITDAVMGAHDGWTWALGDVLAWRRGESPEPDWPWRLGSLTAELHADLLATQPEHAGSGDHVRGDARRAAANGLELRRRASQAIADACELVGGATGVRLRHRRGALQRAVDTLPERPIGRMFDGHGDLHVGQVLRSREAGRSRYWLVDFDGDPQLTAAEREQPDSSARDVAHLAVSFDLVAAVAFKRLGEVDRAVLEWADRAKTALVNAYRARAEELGIDREFDERLLPGFMAEQLARELLYAERFLPRWRYAPDAVISIRYPRDPAARPDTTPEEPWSPPAFEKI
ncbi:hypothetical protein [Ruicaihuangia caeni]|uniref:hypothetical protein n=1 Tax=Ruicaihuangia caeni TaxID=3042517 RepID=UPI00338FFA30